MIRPGVRSLLRLPIRRRERMEQELDEEIRLHLEMRVEQLLRRGVPPEEARREAMRRFGSISDARQELIRAARERDASMYVREWLADLRQDVSFTTRTLLKSPGFTIAVVLTLALGIGATSAMYSVVEAVLLRSFGFAAADRLAVLTEVLPTGETHNSVSPANFFDWREQSRSFEELAAYTERELILTGAGEPEELPTRFATGNYFTILGARPLLGRTFTVADEPSDVAVLSHRLWQRRFGGDRAVIGRTITLNDGPVTVIGVMPAGLPSLGEKPELWVPTQLDPEWRGRFLRVIGRLAPGADLEQARTEMRALGSRLSDAYPAFNKDWSIRVLSLDEAVAGDVRPALLVMFGAVGLLLLIACANVANLLLSRAATRRREVALRRALGASRGRLVRQLLTESLVLAALAGVLGLFTAWVCTRLLVLRIPAALALPRLDEIALNPSVVAFTAGVSLLTGLIFGLAPALLGASGSAAQAVREGARGATPGQEQRRLRSALVAGEVALALLLLVGAGLLARSFQNLLSVDVGLETEQVTTMRLAARAARYQEPAALRELTAELQRRIAALPGVRAVGIGGPWLPLTGDKSGMPFQRDDRPPAPVGEEPGADIRLAGGDYYRVMGVPLLRGRAFDERDTETSPDAIIINDALARRFFPGENPVGKRITFEWYDTLRAEVVGVVGSIRELGPAAEPAPAIYIPFRKRPDDVFHVVVRAAGDPNALAVSLRQIVHAIDPNQPVSEIRTMEDVAGGALARPRLNLMLLGLFSLLALVLAAIGLYGVIAYSVAQRRTEIGVRVALGAGRNDVLRLVVGEGMRLTLAGLGLGLAGALALTRLMESMLFGVRPADPLTLAGVAALLATIALVACWLPARRAAATDPAVALRAD